MTDVDIDRMDTRINQLGASLFFDPVTVGFAAERGISNVFVLYAGRVGVMGDVTAAQAVSALCFFDPGVVADVWGALGDHGGPAAVGEVFGAAMAAAAATHWPADAAATVHEIGRRVISGVPAMGMALYAGWAERARHGTVSDVVHALRELRGDIHIQSVAAQGLHPLEAEMVTRGAPAAQLHGWKTPYPDPAAFVERVAAADAHTSARMAELYRRTLDAETLARLDEAVGVMWRAHR